MNFLRQDLFKPLGRNILDTPRDFRVDGAGIVCMACAAGIVQNVRKSALDRQWRLLLDDLGNDGFPHSVRFVGGRGHDSFDGRFWLRSLMLEYLRA